MSVLVSLICLLLAYSLKMVTEFFEHKLFHFVHTEFRFLFIVLPTLGITGIYFLRKRAFFNKKKQRNN